ncbi:MAG: enoyl-CoA hydratase/isomerase family protein [Chitinophagales bacterium]|jgi:methylglutaconyl-CoA hydratase|nr:enoyl-CoA hydratase/isomerase family protein [Chitinophagales bacterium]
METAYVNAVRQGALEVIEFYHPQSNSLPRTLLTQLAAAITAAGEDAEVKLILLRSRGEKVFCAGASFDELASITTAAEGLRFFSGFAEVINAIRNCPLLVIGRIQGKCVGGGVGLAAAVDYALATDQAHVKLSELAVGIGPFVVGPAVERKIGLSAFSQLAIDATEWRSAEWAHQKGLFAALFADSTGLDEGINRLVAQLLQSSPAALREIKKICWEGTEHWTQLLQHRASISGRLVLSEESKKAIERFKQK